MVPPLKLPPRSTPSLFRKTVCLGGSNFWGRIAHQQSFTHVWICIKITLYNEIYSRVILAVYRYILALDTAPFLVRIERIVMGEILLKPSDCVFGTSQSILSLETSVVLVCFE